MALVKHGDVVLIRSTPEQRGRNGMIDMPVQAFVAVQTDQDARLHMEPISCHALRAVAPEKYDAVMAELKADRDMTPVGTMPSEPTKD